MGTIGNGEIKNKCILCGAEAFKVEDLDEEARMTYEKTRRYYKDVIVIDNVCKKCIKWFIDQDKRGTLKLSLRLQRAELLKHFDELYWAGAFEP